MRPISLAEFKKMKTRLNMWQTRDLSLYGRTLLAKIIGVSQLIYVASMLLETGACSISRNSFVDSIVVIVTKVTLLGVFEGTNHLVAFDRYRNLL